MDFCTAAKEHRERWPEMEAQDFGKLAYQSEFGPAHLLAAGPAGALAAIVDECARAGDGSPPPEDIGSGLCRFHLTRALGSPDAASLLARMFTATAESCRGRGSAEGLREKLRALDALGIPGWTAWREEYEARGFPAVRHSGAFRTAYRPRYRLLSAGFARFFPALLALERLSRAGRPAVAAADGRCGSGKSGLAAAARQVISCQVVHMDGFYLPPEHRGADWESIPAGNMDLERFSREALRPALEGRPVRYRPCVCRTGQPGEEEAPEGFPLTLVEGSYSHHPALADAYRLKIFLTCAPEEQERRLREREGARFAAFRERWIPMEERYFRAFDVEKRADLVLDTTGFFR